jgi:hypothetical protein
MAIYNERAARSDPIRLNFHNYFAGFPTFLSLGRDAPSTT